MTTGATARGIRPGAVALAGAGALFALFPLLRPWSDKVDGPGGLIEAAASPMWVVAHLCGAGAFLLVCLGALAVRDAHRGTAGERTARAAVVALWLGSGLTLLFFGAETFALHALAQAEAPVALLDAVREGPAALIVFALGLLLVAVGAVLLAVAVWRGGIMGRASAVLVAALLALYLPQFFLPPAGRIIHGVLTAAGALWLAAALWRARSR